MATNHQTGGPMRAFHNDPTMQRPSMTTDELCVAALREGFVTVDAVRGHAYAKRFAGKRLGSMSTKGYVVCTLHCHGERKQIKLHRLIWISVHGIPALHLMPDHINRIKHDNRIANLQLVDALGNAKNRRSYVGEQNPAAKITYEIANMIRQRNQELQSYKKTSKEFMVSTSLVAKIVRGEMWG